MEMWQALGRLKISCDFAVLGKVMRNNGRFLVVVLLEGDRRVVVICLTLTTSAQVYQSFRNVLCRAIGREVTYHCFYGLLGLWKEGVIGEVIVGEVGFDGFEVCHVFGDDSGSISCATELKVTFDHVFQLILQLKHVGFRCQDYSGWYTCFARDFLLICSGLCIRRIRVRCCP
jgi:hypothetical protein